jgi:integrase
VGSKLARVWEMPLNRDGGKWDGGYVSVAPNGQRTYVIEREITDRFTKKRIRFHISTRAHTVSAAAKHWERFQADPANYSPVGAAEDIEGVHLTPELAARFTEWMRTRHRPASLKWTREVGVLLGDWATDLKGIDLRRVSLTEHLKPALAARKTSRQHRIIAIKSFYKWLRTEADVGVRSQHDPTLDLMVPQAVPEKRRRRKAVPLAHLRKVAPRLPLALRDCLVVMADSGMHVTELERFVRDPESELVRAKRKDTIGVMVFRHKSRKMHTVAINRADVFAAAERRKKRGQLPRRMNKALAKACRAAKVPVFTFGVMRHSFATLNEERNVAASDAIRVTGHADEKTYKTFYADMEIPVRGFRTPKLT